MKGVQYMLCEVTPRDGVTVSLDNQSLVARPMYWWRTPEAIWYWPKLRGGRVIVYPGGHRAYEPPS